MLSHTYLQLMVSVCSVLCDEACSLSPLAVWYSLQCGTACNVVQLHFVLLTYGYLHG